MKRAFTSATAEGEEEDQQSFASEVRKNGRVKTRGIAGEIRSGEIRSGEIRSHEHSYAKP